MTIKKPKLSLDEQIEHLKDKGILFNIMDESDAKKYLEQNNNYFKLTAYRKNYNKHPDGKNKGKYINLEFAYLVDMAIIDMRLRYQIVHMALDRASCKTPAFEKTGLVWWCLSCMGVCRNHNVGKICWFLWVLCKKICG